MRISITIWLSLGLMQECYAGRDLNNDGKLDAYFVNKKGGAVELLDLNFDGKLDRKNYFGSHDIITFSEFDQDFDGSLESKEHYSAGVNIKVSVDRDADGKVDLVFLHGPKEQSCSIASVLDGIGYEKNYYEFGYPKSTELIEYDGNIIELTYDIFCVISDD